MEKRYWIARDRDGRLFLYKAKPVRNEKFGAFSCTDKKMWKLSIFLDEDYPEVTWENSPKEVELKILGS